MDILEQMLKFLNSISESIILSLPMHNYIMYLRSRPELEATVTKIQACLKAHELWLVMNDIEFFSIDANEGSSSDQGDRKYSE